MMLLIVSQKSRKTAVNVNKVAKANENGSEVCAVLDRAKHIRSIQCNARPITSSPRVTFFHFSSVRRAVIPQRVYTTPERKPLMAIYQTPGYTSKVDRTGQLDRVKTKRSHPMNAAINKPAAAR
jgi:hypothetical protein